MGVKVDNKDHHEMESEGFQVVTKEDAEVFVDMCATFAFKYWIELVMRDMDISVRKLNGLSATKMSIEDLGKSVLVVCAKRDSYQSLLDFVREQREAADRILNERKGTDNG